MCLEGVEKLLLAFYLILAVQDHLRLVEHRTSFPVGSRDMLSHFSTAVVQAGDGRTDPFELQGHLAEILNNLAIALDELFLHIETQVPPGFRSIGKFAFIVGS